MRQKRSLFRPVVEALETRLTPAVTFAAQQTFAVGTGPSSEASGDFNGDGQPDLAVVNNNGLGASTVSVLLNTSTASGGLSFAAQQTFAVGTNAFGVVVADFNGDGRPDLAVVNHTDNTVSVLLNTTSPGVGTVSFAAQQTFAVGAGPFYVAAADVNGDGRPDLVVTNSADNTVSVLLNTTAAKAGTASFATQQTFATGAIPWGVALGDVNGDGRPDLVIANYGNNNGTTVSVLLNTTAAGANTASFAAQQTFATGNGPFSVAMADVNGDGRPDLAVTNAVNNTVSVLLNTTSVGASTASFAAQQTFATGNGPFSVAAGDLDGDGRPDLAISNYSSNTVSVLLNTTTVGASTASFAAQQTFATGNNPYAVVMANVYGSGRADLAVANFNSNNASTVSVLQNITSAYASTTPVVVCQFGTTGVWELNKATGPWVQLTQANASALAADPQGDVAGTFPGHGIWLYKPSTGWKQIGTGDASLLAMDAQGDVAGSFPGAGIWLYRPTVGFRQIGSGNASTLAMDAQGDLVGSFPMHGTWLYRPAIGFQQIGTGNASILTMDALGDVIGSFPGAGIWEYRPAVGFQQISPTDATALAADPYGGAVASIAGVGVEQYLPSVGWRLYLPAVAAVLGMDALGDVFGSFTGYGVWETGAIRFGTRIHITDASLLVVA
jgi:hypothetical protein